MLINIFSIVKSSKLAEPVNTFPTCVSVNMSIGLCSYFRTHVNMSIGFCSYFRAHVNMSIGLCSYFRAHVNKSIGLCSYFRAYVNARQYFFHVSASTCHLNYAHTSAHTSTCVLLKICYASSSFYRQHVNNVIHNLFTA